MMISTTRPALALALPLALLATGCAIGATKTRYSRPQLPGVGQRFQHYTGEMFVLPRVDLQVEVGNGHTKTLLILPLPFYFGEPKSGARPTFRVAIRIIAKEEGLVFQPQTLAYLPQDSAPQGPVSMVGPEDCGSQQGPPDPVAAPLPAFALTQGRCYRMVVDFAGSAPDTTANFGLAPGTLLTPHGLEALPVVRFAEDTQYDSLAVP